MRLTVRDARVGDAAALGRIKQAGWRAAYTGLLPEAALAALDAAEIAAGFARGITDVDARGGQGEALLVAETGTGAGADIVGYVVTGPYRWDELPAAGEVYALYVDPSHWGEGAGTALLSAAEARLREAGHTEAALWVLEDNRAGRGFYEAAGWRADGERGERCEVGGAVEVRYRRPLAQ